MRNLEDRFWEKVNVEDPDKCWLWKASIAGQGYGFIRNRLGISSSHVWSIVNYRYGDHTINEASK